LFDVLIHSSLVRVDVGRLGVVFCFVVY
jgi:hypothetical protein